MTEVVDMLVLFTLSWYISTSESAIGHTIGSNNIDPRWLAFGIVIMQSTIVDEPTIVDDSTRGNTMTMITLSGIELFLIGYVHFSSFYSQPNQDKMKEIGCDITVCLYYLKRGTLFSVWKAYCNHRNLVSSSDAGSSSVTSSLTVAPRFPSTSPSLSSSIKASSHANTEGTDSNTLPRVKKEALRIFLSFVTRENPNDPASEE